jgi:thioredoxin reductase (NADPH)
MALKNAQPRASLSVGLLLLLILAKVGARSSSHSAPWLTLRGGQNEEVEKVEKPVVEREVVIVGSGPSGCTAAIYAGRAMLSPLVIAGYNAGGQLMLTSDVENFPGYQAAVGGPELMGDLFGQASRFGAEFWRTDCKSVDFTRSPFRLELQNCTVMAKSVIISTGAEAQWLNAEREEEFKGKGISTCATCDGYMFRNKPVVVVGGGDSAMEEANFLTRFASSVTLIHRRDTFRASKLMLKRATDNKKITLLTHKRIVRWHGDNGVLSGLTIEDPRDGHVEDVRCDGAFIAIGHRPNTEFLKGQLLLDENGYIKVLENTMTSVPGVFACGDVVDTRYRQAITAAGSGCQSAIDCERWLEAQHQREGP